MNTKSYKGADAPFFHHLAIVMLTTAALLLLPLIAMQFDSGVVWTLSDFVIAGALLGGAGLLFIAALRLVRRPAARWAVGLVLAVALALTWIELAVGLFGTRFAGT